MQRAGGPSPPRTSVPDARASRQGTNFLNACVGCGQAVRKRREGLTPPRRAAQRASSLCPGGRGNALERASSARDTSTGARVDTARQRSLRAGKTQDDRLPRPRRAPHSDDHDRGSPRASWRACPSRSGPRARTPKGRRSPLHRACGSPQAGPRDRNQRGLRCIEGASWRARFGRSSRRRLPPRIRHAPAARAGARCLSPARGASRDRSRGTSPRGSDTRTGSQDKQLGTTPCLSR